MFKTAQCQGAKGIFVSVPIRVGNPMRRAHQTIRSHRVETPPGRPQLGRTGGLVTVWNGRVRIVYPSTHAG